MVEKTESNLSPARFGAAYRAFMEAVAREAVPAGEPLRNRVEKHLGVDPTDLPVVTEEFDTFEHPNLQVTLDAYQAAGGRQIDLVGVASDHKRYMTLSLSELLIDSGTLGRSAYVEGPVDYVNFHLAGDQVLACVQFGLYLIAEEATGARLVVFVTGPSDQAGPRQKLRVDVMATRPEDGKVFLAALLESMKRLNVYRGHVISLSPGQLGMGPQALVAFHTLPSIERDDVILPSGLLERVERQTVVFAAHSARLLAAGRSLKRGLLLHGPPGVGKTLTLMYLIGRMPGRTTILTTGLGMGLLQPVAQMARTLAPSMVVLEDVDLIAEERGSMFHSSGPLLFELLNEMDGLNDDADVIFALTTNRPEILEPALSARPGRIDLAVGLPLPDAGDRQRLLALYARGLDLQAVDLAAVARRTDGATPAFIKELLRRSAVLAVADDGETTGGITITAGHLDAALTELNEGGTFAKRIAGFRATDDAPGLGGRISARPTRRGATPTIADE